MLGPDALKPENADATLRQLDGTAAVKPKAPAAARQQQGGSSEPDMAVGDARDEVGGLHEGGVGDGKAGSTTLHHGLVRRTPGWLHALHWLCTSATGGHAPVNSGGQQHGQLQGLTGAQGIAKCGPLTCLGLC